MQHASRPKILVCFGTRPEAIKMFPVVHALKAHPAFETRVVVTAQHRGMLDQVLQMSEIVPDIDLDLMQDGQSLDALSSRIITSFGAVLDVERPDRVLVHGDTLTAMMVSLACYFRKIPVGHVEAGLRSGNIYAPWPEELNRRVTAIIADLHFAPTQRARQALLAETIADENIFVTGNTVVDALLETKRRIIADPGLATAIEPLLKRFDGKRIVAVTAHRRENFGEGLTSIAKALVKLAERDDVAIIFPVHPNPAVSKAMVPLLEGIANIALIEPLDYPNFARMLDASDLILTDSGGIQEEAPSFQTPVLIMRETTERSEAIEAGTARLVGTSEAALVAAANQLLDSTSEYEAMASNANPFGDGNAAHQIVQILYERHFPGST
ncbi:MAG: UDP-N-acetylglucosamine 2-epimerase (non-hydrolyzing) [Sphingomonadales bacterium]|nr:UDP-N-acetylglucosamine 2-epimerase (non-hydrolyzing) [Sphingomonadales bacterium]NCQ22663.1 UDP-N-acetylglucosamine 2-epimerase (non-hydrolyzing) [Sphingomonadales bacterium]NCT04865.1 UDP-N-acetylglucosamine 2-epimerase (non-hydrolyzing) [Sphingomonadales bacterium]